MSAPKPKLDIDAIRERLAALNLGFAAEVLETTLSEALKHSISSHALLDALVEAEIAIRERRRVKTALRFWSLPTGFTLGGSTSPSSPPSSAAALTRWPPAPGCAPPRPC